MCEKGNFKIIKKLAAIAMYKPIVHYLLQQADSSLILTQRNGAWCGHGPILEQDIAITNITLDLIGQTRNFYQYAAQLINESNADVSATEDSLAYLRTEREFKNCLLAEQPNGDWAQTITRQFFYSVYQYFLYERLQESTDAQLAAIAAKSFKEAKYHITWCTDWVLRLGDGTAESNLRMKAAIENLWPYTGELFVNQPYETTLEAAGTIPASATIKELWLEKITQTFREATLAIPEKNYMHTGGKQGIHTEHMGFILSEMQYLQRTYPGASW